VLVDEAADAAILAMVERETTAWDRRDADALVQLFHPDMVWPWPPSERSHDPITWVMPMGRFEAERWRASWQELFDTHELVSNDRAVRRIETIPEGDGGFAVVDIDTRWRRRVDGHEEVWRRRVCKVYSRCAEGWKITMHTGVLVYE
jgi:ketosteroid isomerase-like protein